MDVDEPELSGIKIKVSSIWEEFQCPICFNVMKDAAMTPCGHNMCNECLLECINREHVCPCCRGDCVQDQIIRNLHLDKLIGVIEKEKEEEEKLYFENIVKGGVPMEIDPKGEAPTKELSPVELVFQNKLQSSLRTYQKYYEDLRVDFERAKVREKRVCDADVLALRKRHQKEWDAKNGKEADVADDQLKQRCMALMSASEKKFAELDAKFQDSVALLLRSYENYSNNVALDPRILPTILSINIASKNIILKDVELNPGDTCADVRKIIEEKMEEEHHDAVQEFTKNNIFVLQKPQDSIAPAGIGGIILQENQPIISTTDAPNGSIIVLQGELHLKSDDPPLCFTAIFKKGEIAPVDYFTCRDCHFNWICRECAENCHKGHSIVEYLRGHKPTWACCYCVKHGKCRIINNKNKDKMKFKMGTHS